MRQLATEIEIDAPAERVWLVLTDLDRYPDWNPFIPEISGELCEGSRLRVRIAPPGGRAMTFRPRVTKLEAARELRWLGQLVLPGLFDGLHAFRLHPVRPGRVRLVHGEVFRGLLVPLFWGGMEEPTRRGFEAMNRALKRRAEAATLA